MKTQTLQNKLSLNKYVFKILSTYHAIFYVIVREAILLKIISEISKEALKKVDSDFKKAIMPRVLSELPKIPITVEELRFLYFDNKAISEETLMNYADFLGDVMFYRGTMEVADIQMSSNDYTPTYLYKFSYESKTYLAKKIMDVSLPGNIIILFKTT